MQESRLPISRELFLYYHGIGDSLLLNTVLYGLGTQNHMRYILGSPHPEIYRGNPYVIHLPFSQSINYKLARILRATRAAKNVIHVDYYQEGRVPQKHILHLLSERLGLQAIPSKPAVFLNKLELAERSLPSSTKPWIAIQSTGNSRWTDNKNWGVQNFNCVVKLLADQFSFVQIGSQGDPALEGVLNLTGKLTQRQVFLILKQCEYFVGQVGFLMHAAAAMDVPSVIIYGGFEAPWQSGYTKNVNLYSPVSCAPCWLESKCPHDKMCMTSIQQSQVVQSLLELRTVSCQ
jgi:hypothetical protein